ncbi:MAG: hypothetical protein QG608_308 [Actinomycetota bacterium]|nr:hypothetical protein [Actinomycetota bacterium]
MKGSPRTGYGSALPLRALRTRSNNATYRLRVSAWSVGQSALAAFLAWEAAVHLLGHRSPFFAAVAAIICLGTSQIHRIRRVLELAVGVAIGVALADLLVQALGRGGWQIGVVVLLGMFLALVVDGGNVIVNQAALQGLFVTVLPTPPGGVITRWQDALIGGALALAVAALLPSDPRTAVRRENHLLAAEMTQALRLSALAARDADLPAAGLALETARGTEPHLRDWQVAVVAGEEINRISPLRNRARAELEANRVALLPVDRAVRNLRVAVRRLLAAVEDLCCPGQWVPPGPTARTEPPAMSEPVLQAVERLADVLEHLPEALRDPQGPGAGDFREGLRALTTEVSLGVTGPGTLSETVVVAQLRSAAIDLFEAVGLSHPQARAMLSDPRPPARPPSG